jgi:2-methylisocitrate lyase-like PEP mutase family enzyme
MLANMADGGRTPIRTALELAGLGYACAIFPSMTALAASAAIMKSLENLRGGGSSVSSDVALFPFDEFCKMVGFEAVWAFEERWKEVLDKQNV